MSNQKSRITNRKSPDDPIPRSPDPRHQALMAEIDRLYRAYNDELPPPDMGRTAKALAEFLRANPKWPLKTVQRAMRNRFASAGMNFGEAPWLWLKHLPSYVADPLDKFRQPVRGKGNEVFAWWEEKNREAVSSQPSAISEQGAG